MESEKTDRVQGWRTEFHYLSTSGYLGKPYAPRLQLIFDRQQLWYQCKHSLASFRQLTCNRKENGRRATVSIERHCRLGKQSPMSTKTTLMPRFSSAQFQAVSKFKQSLGRIAAYEVRAEVFGICSFYLCYMAHAEILTFEPYSNLMSENQA